MIIFDTDILSTFAKINKLKLLFAIFSGNELAYAPSVRTDLENAEKEGHRFVKHIFNEEFKLVRLSDGESNLIKIIAAKRKGLHLGELESLAVCKSRGCVFVTNDITARKTAYNLGVECLGLSDILKSLITENILAKENVHELIAKIESKDKVEIIDKDKILKE